MIQHRLRQFGDTIRRLLKVTTLAEHESVLQRLESLSSQMNALPRLIRSEAAAGLETTLQSAWSLEERLRMMLDSELGRTAMTQEARFEELRINIQAYLDVIKSWDLDRWKIAEYEGLLRYLRRQDYLRAIREGSLAVPRLETQHPVAISSNDTKFPRGSRNDNSIAPRFNRKLYGFLGDDPNIRVLDIGCAGGGFVRSLIDDGHFAVGLEGSDYPLLNQTGEWATISLHLFTCDVTKRFQLTNHATGEPLRFEAITAWELMEHIPEDGLASLFENLDRHLAPNGYLLFSIATFLDWDSRTGVIWHVTVKPRGWWEDLFAKQGFIVEEQHPFGKDDWLRGSGRCRGDWHEDDGLGFHVVLRRRGVASAAAQGRSEWRASVA